MSYKWHICVIYRSKYIHLLGTSIVLFLDGLPSSVLTGGMLLVVGGGVTQAAVSVECHVGEERAGEEGEALKHAEFNKTIDKVKCFHYNCDIP